MIERYTLPEMGAIWAEENRFQKWLDVEIAVCEVHAEMGTIPREAVEKIKRAARFSVDRIKEIERATRHDVIAFTTALLENIDRLGSVLSRRAAEFKHAQMIGRTHGVHAEPTTFGLVLALYYADNG